MRQDALADGYSHLAMARELTDTMTAPSSFPAIDTEAALKQHGDWLRSVIAARLGEPQAVDEVMQEVAMAVVANKAPLTDADKLAPWLYQIAVRQTLLYRRKHGRRRNLISRYADREQPRETDTRSPNPLDWLLAEERASRIRDAMEQLTNRDREILMLKYNHGWSYRDLSEHLGISESAVEARLHRARGRLRSKLEQLDVVPKKQR